MTSGSPTHSMGGGPRLAWAVLVGVIILPSVTAQYYADLQGNYCRYRRPTQCCDGRYDECAVPILGTLCYCDQFCDRTSPDCCPDYREVCLGIVTPPPEIRQTCFKDGVRIPPGMRHKFNCNTCTCTSGTQIDCEQDACMIDENVIRQINDSPRRYGWRASNNTDFWGRKTREGLIFKTGTLNPEVLSLKMYPILLTPDLAQIPREFDARNKREWYGRVSDADDQGWCGASWAFSTLGVAQDRLSIESYGNETVRLSPQHLISCDRRGQKGCEGGRVDRAWQYLRRIGVANRECYEYESGLTGKSGACQIPRSVRLADLNCPAANSAFHRNDLYKTEPSYRISGKEEDIQWEILKNGPVQAMMTVHPDLFMYESGIYSYSGLTGNQHATHSVRLVGWGEERVFGDTVKYWVAANSWGHEWGERGFFRIKRGTNESDIESFIIAVRARLKDYSRRRQRYPYNDFNNPLRRFGRRTQNYYSRIMKKYNQKSN